MKKEKRVSFMLWVLKEPIQSSNIQSVHWSALLLKEIPKPQGDATYSACWAECT